MGEGETGGRLDSTSFLDRRQRRGNGSEGVEAVGRSLPVLILPRPLSHLWGVLHPALGRPLPLTFCFAFLTGSIPAVTGRAVPS